MREVAEGTFVASESATWPAPAIFFAQGVQV
jgi:hypothetical protein